MRSCLTRLDMFRPARRGSEPTVPSLDIAVTKLVGQTLPDEHQLIITGNF